MESLTQTSYDHGNNVEPVHQTLVLRLDPMWIYSSTISS